MKYWLLFKTCSVSIYLLKLKTKPLSNGGGPRVVPAVNLDKKVGVKTEIHVCSKSAVKVKKQKKRLNLKLKPRKRLVQNKDQNGLKSPSTD